MNNLNKSEENEYVWLTEMSKQFLEKDYSFLLKNLEDYRTKIYNFNQLKINAIKLVKIYP